MHRLFDMDSPLMNGLNKIFDCIKRKLAHTRYPALITKYTLIWASEMRNKYGYIYVSHRITPKSLRAILAACISASFLVLPLPIPTSLLLM